MSQIGTYYHVAQNTWDEAVAYRLNFTIWRLRNVLLLLTTYFLWFTLLPSEAQFAGYSQSIMLTYIIGVSFLNAFVFSTRTQSIGDDIVQGDLSSYLVRPLHYFRYYFARDMGDKLMNIFFSFFEVSLIILILHPPLFLQTNPLTLFFFLMSVCLAILLNFYCSVLLSFIGFWSSEVWAPRFIFSILLTFLAGGLFPLNILPFPIYTILTLLPFPYLLYTPMKIYLGQYTLWQILVACGISCLWVFLLYIFTKKIWQKGLRLYSAEGS